MDFIKQISKRIKNSKYFGYYLAGFIVLVVGITVIIIAPWQSSAPEPGTVIAEPTPTPEPIPTSTPTPEPAPEPEPDIEPEPEPTPEPERGMYNPLTGEPTRTDISRNRPIAIVLANTTEALPMNGVSDADILYELPVEGGLTRMLGIFQDFSDVSKAGSIRSIRHYTVQIAESYDAILLASGGSEPALNEVRDRNITYLQEGARGSTVFVRDRNRIPGRRVDGLHSVVTTNYRLIRWLDDSDLRLEHDANRENVLKFTDNATPVGGADALQVVVRFSTGKNSTFEYNADSNVYHMRQFNRDFIDANDDERVSFTNLLIIKTPVTALSGQYAGAGRRDMPTTGTGEGYFVHGGKFIEIIWSRADKASQFVYTLRDGTELNLGRGNTYIGVVPTNMRVDFE
jgi:hypothetical protein